MKESHLEIHKSYIPAAAHSHLPVRGVFINFASWLDYLQSTMADGAAALPSQTPCALSLQGYLLSLLHSLSSL